MVLVIVGIALGFAARWIQEVRDRGEAQRALVAKSVDFPELFNGHCYRVEFAPETRPSWWTAQVQGWVHPEYGRKIDCVTINDFVDSPEFASQIEKVFDVGQIKIYGSISSKALRRCFRAHSLNSLSFFGTVTDPEEIATWDPLENATTLEYLHLRCKCLRGGAFSKQLSKLPNLQGLCLSLDELDPQIARDMKSLFDAPKINRVILEGPDWDFYHGTKGITRMSPHQYAEFQAAFGSVLLNLNRCEQLQELSVTALHIKDPKVFVEFCDESPLRSLKFYSCDINTQSFAALARLRNLEHLSLRHTYLDADSVPHLKSLKNLKSLRLGPAGEEQSTLIDDLSRALPNCKVTES